jgi:hypothetical protein
MVRNYQLPINLTNRVNRRCTEHTISDEALAQHVLRTGGVTGFEEPADAQ